MAKLLGKLRRGKKAVRGGVMGKFVTTKRKISPSKNKIPKFDTNNGVF